MQNRTEIVYVIPRPEIGGAEKQLLRLIEHLDQRRYRSTVICLDGGGTLLPDYVAIADDVIVLDRQGVFEFRTFIGLLSHIRHIRPTTVHTTLYIANLFGGWAAKLAGVPRVVVSQRGLGIDPRHGKLKRVVHAIFNGFIGTFADVRTVNSRAIADRMADHGWTDCQVIYNGILDRPVPDRGRLDALRQEFEIPSESTILTAVSRIDPKKDMSTKLKAFDQVRDQHPDTYLLVAGGGFTDYHQDLVQLAHRLDIIDHLRFLGFRDDASDLLALGDISLLSSVTEGLPNAILESMLMARPVVATAVGGVPELVEDGVEGYLVPKGDSCSFASRICDLIENPVRRESMGILGRARALSEFSIQKTVARTTDIYLRRPSPQIENIAYPVHPAETAASGFHPSSIQEWAQSA